MSRISKFFVAVTISCLATAGTTFGGNVVATDDFAYADGSSLTANAAWTEHSGTAGDLLVNGGAAVVQHGTPSEDVNISFGSFSSGVIDAAFDVVVNDDTAITGGDYEYFAHFFTTGSFNFRSRLDVVEAAAGGDYALGISSTSSTAEATTAVDFNFGDVVPVILSFDLDTGIGSLTAGGATIFGTSAALGETLDLFALRQSDSSNNETITVDNLVISHCPVPEPNPLLLGSLAAIFGLVGLRRRK